MPLLISLYSCLLPSLLSQDESALAKQRASVVVEKIVSLTDERLSLVKKLEASVSKGKQVKRAQPVQQEVRGGEGEWEGERRGGVERGRKEPPCYSRIKWYLVICMLDLCPHSQLKSVSEKWKQASDKVDEEVGKLSQDAPDAVGKVTTSLLTSALSQGYSVVVGKMSTIVLCIYFLCHFSFAKSGRMTHSKLFV